MGTQLQSLVRELDPACCNEDLAQPNKYISFKKKKKKKSAADVLHNNVNRLKIIELCILKWLTWLQTATTTKTAKERSCLSSFNILGLLGPGYSRVLKVLTSNVMFQNLLR